MAVHHLWDDPVVPRGVTAAAAFFTESWPSVKRLSGSRREQRFVIERPAGSSAQIIHRNLRDVTRESTYSPRIGSSQNGSEASTKITWSSA